MTKDISLLSADEIKASDIRYVFFDIDGTILDLDGQYSPRLKTAISALHARGIRTGVASGRPLFASQFLIEELGLSAAGVFCTGAHIHEPGSQTTLKAHYIEPNNAVKFLRALRGGDLYYEVYTGDQFYYEQDRAPTIRHVHQSHLRCEATLANFDEVITNETPAMKFLIGTDSPDGAALLAELEAKFPEFIFAYAGLPAYPEWRFASIISRSACKKAAFEFVLTQHGISADNVASFGDAQSDMTFLSLAGMGVAMGNANDAVKSVARYTTKPVWEDGLAYAIERLILN